MQEQETPPGADGAVQTGLVVGTGDSSPKKATAGQTRMEVLMEQYAKQTAEHHKRQDAAQGKLTGPDATARGSLDMSFKGRLVRKMRRSWLKVTKCVDCLCNGAGDDSAATMPIMLGSHYRRIVDTLGGESAELPSHSAAVRGHEPAVLFCTVICFSAVTQPQLKTLQRLFNEIDFR